MTLPEVYVSKPAVSFPKTKVDNAEVLRRVRERYRGAEEQWPTIEATIGRVFDMCNTKVRYLETDPKARVADYAASAATECLKLNDTSIDDVDLVIFSGISRQYFEPATAMEVAAKLGLNEMHAFDVTSACVGLLEAIQVAVGYLAIHDDYHTVLVCTAELSGPFLSYDIQVPRDLYLKAAGLTIGNAAASVLIRRTPWPDGSLHLLHIKTYTLPTHWELCQVPINGTFQSSSIELMKLHTQFTPRLKKSIAAIGWEPNDVDHYVFHQPSELMIRKVLENSGVDATRAVYSHHMYANNASATVAVAFNKLLAEREVKSGDKFILGSAAAGFTMVVAGGQWVIA